MNVPRARRGTFPWSLHAALALSLSALQPAAAAPSTPAPATPPAPADTQPIRCEGCDQWNAEHAPFQIYGNTYYVGTQGLSSVLVTSKGGHVLIDGALPQSAAVIAAHVRALGFRIEDVRWIVNSHAHFDHAGGIAALQRMSGAQVAASPHGAGGLRAGATTLDDPQAGYRAATHFPKVPRVAEIKDGGTVQAGDVVLTAHHTPGHTPGSTTWTWRSCEAARCLDMVYADSLNAVSAPGFRYAGDGSRVASFRRSIEHVRGLPCDVLMSAHPDNSSLFERQRARAQGPAGNTFIDGAACRAYADEATKRLDRKLEEEEQTGAQKPRPAAGAQPAH